MSREERYIDYDERIDRYLRNLMDDSERTAFEQEVDNDQELRERLVATALLVKGIAQAGMQREGQAQLETIKQMNREEFIQATQGKNGRNRMWTFMKWASGIAAIAIVAYGLYMFYPSHTPGQTEQTAKVEETPVKTKATPKPTKPSLASLADEYNKSFGNEPDEFVSIRQQIKKGASKDMMAVVEAIDKIEAPTFNEGAMGAENAEVIKEMQQMHNDCTHWYKALAYLKKGDKENAINELNQLIEQDHNTILVERATELLKKLK